MLCCHCKKNQATKTYEKVTDGKSQTEYYCLDCGTSEEDFRTRGLVGCAQCYQSLARTVIPVVIRMQGNEIHCGKKPKNSGDREELIRRRNTLKKRVEEFIKDKNFAPAKICAEELKALNKKLYGGENDD